MLHPYVKDTHRPFRVNRLKAMRTNVGPERAVPSVLAEVLVLDT